MSDNLGDNKVEVYELYHLGRKVIFRDLPDLMDWISEEIKATDLEEPETMVITKKMMKESVLESLPEFDGY
jgi:hypothetical protein